VAHRERNGLPGNLHGAVLIHIERPCGGELPAGEEDKTDGRQPTPVDCQRDNGGSNEKDPSG
jgi:hypothetical protein